MAFEGVTFEEALIWKQDIEQDERFTVTALNSYPGLLDAPRQWYLHVIFQYRSNRRGRLRIQADLHSRERWKAFARNCREQAEAAMQGARAPSAAKQRAMAGNNRDAG